MKKLLLLASFIGMLFASSQQIDQSFVLKTIDNKTIHITVKDNGIKVKEYPNKVIVLDFFGKHCPPCRMLMPILGEIQKKMGKKVQIIGLHVQQPLNKRDIQELRKRGVNYPVADYLPIKENAQFVEFMGKLTGWQGSIPYMLFFDRKGEYSGYHLGFASQEALEKFIDKLYNLPEKTKKEVKK